jgi:hypothetical protein
VQQDRQLESYSLPEKWLAVFIAFSVGLGWFGGREVVQMAERSHRHTSSPRTMAEKSGNA